MFAVFDGHSGPEVATTTIDALPKRLAAALSAGPSPPSPQQLATILRQAFIEHDKELARLGEAKIGDSGSTASVALVTPTHIVVAYLGDSPAFLMNPTTGLILSEIGKHEPTLAGETARIQAAGGTVEVDEYGTPRVDGSLMVSRAFGDFSLKWPEGAPPPFESDWSRMKVTAYPDISIWTRPDHGVLAIMSDGLVETASGSLKPTAQVAKDIFMALQENAYNLPFTATTVLKRHVASSVGSMRSKYDGDDLTLVIVDVGLRDAREGSAEAAKQAGGVAAAVAAAAAAKPKTRRAKHGRRSRTGKKGRLVKMFSC